MLTKECVCVFNLHDMKGHLLMSEWNESPKKKEKEKKDSI